MKNNSNAHSTILGHALTKRLHACAQGTRLTPDELIQLGVRRLVKEYESRGEIVVLRAQEPESQREEKA